MKQIMEYLKKPWVIALIVCIIIAVVFLIIGFKKQSFRNVLISNNFDATPPKQFSPLDLNASDEIPLSPPVIPEEIGLAMAYPQGSGVGMSNTDSNSFEPSNPNSLLTDYSIPQAYGESNLSDPMGTNGADQGARILKIKNTGNQMAYKPVDESLTSTFAQAYSPSGDVQGGVTLLSGNQQINYTDNFNPEQNLTLQTSPGQESTLNNCETYYPNTVKYNDLCITEGDIPYGQVVDGKVNPRLVSRWESFTGNYSRPAALEPIDGLLYPRLNALESTA